MPLSCGGWKVDGSPLKPTRSLALRRGPVAEADIHLVALPDPPKPAPPSLGDLAELRKAAHRASFVLDYQPRHLLQTGAPVGAEALLRWSNRRPTRSGSAVTTAAERSEAIEIGGLALALACLEAASWPGSATLLSVKVLREQLQSDLLCLQVAEALAMSDLAPDRLELGLPEDVLVTIDDDALFAVAALRDLGLRLSLDEFGQNLTSLSALKRMPVTALKLDRAMIRHLPQDEDGMAVARAVLETARAFGLTVCADGVESPGQRRLLLALGCELGQGSIFSPALSAEEAGDHLLHSKVPPAA
jgi:EAL domain-containing protein (putative c-di-GMP-specific phosphodiesterase class I)